MFPNKFFHTINKPHVVVYSGKIVVVLHLTKFCYLIEVVFTLPYDDHNKKYNYYEHANMQNSIIPDKIRCPKGFCPQYAVYTCHCLQVNYHPLAIGANLPTPPYNISL